MILLIPNGLSYLGRKRVPYIEGVSKEWMVGKRRVVS
jgi:hypothetical protein